MLLDSNYTIVPQIRFTLTYDSGVRKIVTVKTKDTVSCSYKKNGEIRSITGVVSKIGCNFNSSLGAVGTTAYLQIDGSSEYAGAVEYIQPNQIYDITIISTSGTIENVVCSVDNEDQKICLIRENEVGVFQYSLDGITWRAANGKQGMSAYECAVSLGFYGTEEEWLESLKGKKGDDGEPGALEIYKVFNSIREAERNRDLIPKNKLVAVVSDPNSILLVRNGHDREDICPCRDDGSMVESEDEKVSVRGYRFLGFLNLGPQGEPGRPGRPGRDGTDGNNGKSAYQYAVEGGFPGSEAEFMQVLGRSAVAVTNYYSGPKPEFTDTVIGPIDLRIFGYTNPETFKSKSISRIDIDSPNYCIDQTLIFPAPITLRAVPASSDASKPNITIKGKKYVADCIMNKDGEVGVFRRIRYIDSYSGETIIGDWMSSTGELDMGAHVQFVSYGKFEPFDKKVQEQYRKLHTFDGETRISIEESTYVSAVYPIDIKKFVEGYVVQRIDEYIEERVPEIVRPMVEPIVLRVVDEKLITKQDVLTPGKNIEIAVIEEEGESKTVISVTGLGEIPEGKTISEFVSEEVSKVYDKLGEVPEDKTVIDLIEDSSEALNEKIDTEVSTLNNKVEEVSEELLEKIDSEISDVEQKIGNIPTGKTVAEVIEEKSGTLDDKISNLDNKKQDNLTAGRNVEITPENIINCLAESELGETITTTKEVGGIPVGTVIDSTEKLASILITMLCPPLPPVPPKDRIIHYGVSTVVPVNLDGLSNKEIVPEELIAKGFSNRYTADDQYLVFAYNAAFGELISITDPSGFEQLDGWNRITFDNEGTDFYIYYTKETLTISSYKLNFIYTEEE